MNFNKYHATKTEVDGIVFHSKAEANRYCELKLLEKAGEIKDLTLQPKFELQSKFKDKSGTNQRAITYKADFQYYDKKYDSIVIEDVKGFKTKEYELKKKMFLMRYPEYVFLET